MTTTPRVSAVALTIGEPQLERALESLRRQTLPIDDVVVVRDVRPFHRAINDGAARVRHPLFVQVDADMILDPECVELLADRMTDRCGAVVGHLRDALYGRVQGIKLFRTAAYREARMPDTISPDTDLLAAMEAAGWVTVFALRHDVRDPADRDTFGAHAPDYTPLYAFSRHLLDGLRWRYRRRSAALRGQLQQLLSTSHPQGLISAIGVCHGMFLDGERDLLEPYQATQDFDRIQEILTRPAPATRPVPTGCPTAWLAKAAFHAAYRTGAELAPWADAATIRSVFDAAARSGSPFDWVACLGIGRGLCVGAFDRGAAAADWYRIAVFHDELARDAAWRRAARRVRNALPRLAPAGRRSR